MGKPVILDLICPHCAALVRPAEESCLQYGNEVTNKFPAVSESANRARPWIDDPASILGLLFLVLGAAGLPWLWKSQAFSHSTKWLLSIAVLAYTCLLIWLTWIAAGYLNVQIEAIRAAW